MCIGWRGRQPRKRDLRRLNRARRKLWGRRDGHWAGMIIFEGDAYIMIERDVDSVDS
jgi:hypothetical protein